MYDEAAAEKLMNATHNEVAVSLAATANTLASALLQIRAHERVCEHHDDITAGMKDVLLDTIASGYTAIAEELMAAGDFTSNTVTSAFIARCTGLAYYGKMTQVCDGFAKAFGNAPMAMELLHALPGMLAHGIDTTVLKLTAFMRVGEDALNRRMLNSSRAKLLNALHDGLIHAGVVTRTDVDSVFGYSRPDFDVLAKEEHDAYVAALASGANKAAALRVAAARVRSRVIAVMKAISDEHKKDNG